LAIAAKKFAHQLSLSSFKPYSKLTIITYAGDAHLTAEGLTPDDARRKLETLEMIGGGTNFGRALKHALEVA
jgi:hypothetical protein